MRGQKRGGDPPTGGAGPTPPYARRAHARRSRSRRGRGERQLLLCLTESLCKETLCSLAACLSLFVKGTGGSRQSTDALDDARSRPAIDRRKIQRTTTELCHPVS